MPVAAVYFYQETGGKVPVLDWLRDVRRRDRKAFAKCVARILRLAEAGFDLRRPEADYLRDGIHELRVRKGRVNYRILYFYHGGGIAVLAHGLTKEGMIPNVELERAVRRKECFARDPQAHTFEAEFRDDP